MLQPLPPLALDQEAEASNTALNCSARLTPADASFSSRKIRHRRSRALRYSTTRPSFEPNRSYKVFFVTPASSATVSTPTA